MGCSSGRCRTTLRDFICTMSNFPGAIIAPRTGCINFSGLKTLLNPTR
jgi:hypothetical protein